MTHLTPRGFTAAAINRDCLTAEYRSAAANADLIFLLASHNDTVLRLAFPLGDPISNILDHDHAFFGAALGYEGPPPPADPPVAFPWQIQDGYGYKHASYLPPTDPAAFSQRVTDFVRRAFRPPPHPRPPLLPRRRRIAVSDKTYGFETLSVHAGAAPDPTTGARALPIYQTTAYVFEDADHAAALFNLQTVGFIYSRLTNPTNAALETRLATLEGGRGCTVASSGHAAQVLALFPLMSPGAEIVASSRLYGGSLQQMRNTYPKFGWAAKIVDADEPENFKRAGPNTKAFFIESLANPGGVISDIEAIARIAEAPACRCWSTTRWPRPGCASRSTTAPP